MAYIKINIDHPIYDGMPLTFRTPCHRRNTEGITVGTKNFSFRDAAGNTLSTSCELFSEGVLINVILDVTKGFAYIQNAATTGFIDARLNNHKHSANSIDTGSFNGYVSAGDYYQTPSTSLLRNSKLVSTETDATYNGEIFWTYK